MNTKDYTKSRSNRKRGKEKKRRVTAKCLTGCTLFFTEKLDVGVRKKCRVCGFTVLDLPRDLSASIKEIKDSYSVRKMQKRNTE